MSSGSINIRDVTAKLWGNGGSVPSILRIGLSAQKQSLSLIFGCIIVCFMHAIEIIVERAVLNTSSAS
jgi:hypothetical protein